MVYVLIFFWSLISLKINMTGRICIHEETERFIHCDNKNAGRKKATLLLLLFLPEVVNCLPHSLHLRGPSVMWIFK